MKPSSPYPVLSFLPLIGALFPLGVGAQATGPAPAPPVVQAPQGAAPSDAVALFTGRDLGAWEQTNQTASDGPMWKVVDGAIVTDIGAGSLKTKQPFGDIQLHLEYRITEPPKGTGVERANSGVLLMGHYEIQILDTYNNPVPPKRQAGAVYNQIAPMVNASRPPGEWQSLDVLFYTPQPHDRNVVPARVTVFHNGVLVQNDSIIAGATTDDDVAGYDRHPKELPLALEENEGAVTFRNIWVRPIPRPVVPEDDEK